MSADSIARVVHALAMAGYTVTMSSDTAAIVQRPRTEASGDPHEATHLVLDLTGLTPQPPPVDRDHVPPL